MPRFTILMIVLTVMFFITIIIIKIITRNKKVIIAKKKFKKIRNLQNTTLQKIVDNAQIKSWTIKDIKKRQGAKNKNITAKQDEIDNMAGIYGFFIEDKDVSFKEYFIPIYIGKTKNIRSRWIQHASKIEKAYWSANNSEIKYQKIAHYLRLKEKTPQCIRFIVIEKISKNKYDYLCKKREKYWINVSGSGERGFNSIQA